MDDSGVSGQASAAELQPEMETFPILRPDLIPVLSKDWLARSQAALVPLINSLREEVLPRSLCELTALFHAFPMIVSGIFRAKVVQVCLRTLCGNISWCSKN